VGCEEERGGGTATRSTSVSWHDNCDLWQRTTELERFQGNGRVPADMYVTPCTVVQQPTIAVGERGWSALCYSSDSTKIASNVSTRPLSSFGGGTVTSAGL
jgi:hypothetical protein